MRLALLISLIFSLLAGPLRAAEVTVFAAASLKTALEEVAAGWEAATGHDLRLSFAGSSVLARQIAQGAPADLFLSANGDWMDWLEEQGAVDAAQRRDLLGNRLVLIGPAGAEAIAPDALVGDLGRGRLAMALVDAVPAGIYGKAALVHFGQWDGLQRQIVQSDNVRAAQALVAIGAAQAGIVYATDAAAEPRVAVRATYPEHSHPPIRYPVATTAQAAPEAAEFLAHLTGPAAAAIFTRHGFKVLP